MRFPLIANQPPRTRTISSQPPSIYARVDFAIAPERFTVDFNDPCELSPEFLSQRRGLLANKKLVACIESYTMHGDPVADAYATLISQNRIGRLASMLETACEHGLKALPLAQAGARTSDPRDGAIPLVARRQADRGGCAT